MSTKLYDGYRLRTSNIKQLNDALADFRARLTVAAQAEYSAAFGERASLYADARVAGVAITRTRGKGEHAVEEDATANPASSAWQDFHDADREIRRTRQRNPEYDFQCELSVYPGAPWTFVYFIAEPSRSYDEVWQTTPGVESYPYWDNTDPPDGWTYERWRRVRGGQWERRLKAHPLVWSLYGEYRGPNPPRGDELLNAQPPYCDRLRKLAGYVVRQALPEPIQAAIDAARAETHSSSSREWFGMMLDWERSDEFKQQVERASVLLSQLLPDRLELQHFIPYLAEKQAAEVVSADG